MDVKDLIEFVQRSVCTSLAVNILQHGHKHGDVGTLAYWLSEHGSKLQQLAVWASGGRHASVHKAAVL